MPLSVLLEDRAPVTIGNAYTPNGNNIHFNGNYSLVIPYALTAEDYKAGSYQLLNYIELDLNLSPGSQWLGFSESNPRRFNLGEYSVLSLNGFVLQRGTIDSRKQAVKVVSDRYPLNRNEAARPKSLKLSSRPRFNLSNSENSFYLHSGGVTLSPTVYAGGGTLTTPPNPFTESGTITSNGLTDLRLLLQKREFKMDVTDGSLELQTQEGNSSYYPLSATTPSSEFFQNGSISIYLLPGVTGTIKIRSYKLGEFATLPLVSTPTYTPGTFPTL